MFALFLSKPNLIAGVVLLGSHLAFANGEDCISAMELKGTHVELHLKEGVSELASQKVLQVFDSVNSFLGPLRPPSNLVVDLSNRSSMMRHNGNHMDLVTQLTDSDGRSHHPNMTLPIIAHEYGHALFNENMSVLMPQWRALMSLQEKRTQLGEEIRGWVDLKNRHRNAKNIQRVIDRIEELAMQYQNLENLVLNAKVLRTSLPYDEFFADVVGVLYAEDLSAIANGLRFTGKKVSPKHQRANYGLAENVEDIQSYRDFAARHAPEDWVPSSEKHILLALARSHLGTRIMGGQVKAHNKASILLGVLKAIADEMSHRISDPKLFDLSPEVINQRFIEALDRQFPNHEALH